MTDPFPYATTDIVIVQHRWWDANTRRGVQADITWTPITNSGDALTPNLVDVDARGWVKTRTWRSRPHPYSGYLAVPLVATNDPDLSSLAGFAGYRVQATGEAAFTITVDHDVDETPATVEMSQALAQLDPPVPVAPGDTVRAVWLTDLAQITPPSPPSLYFTATQTTALVLDAVGVHDDDPDAHPAIRALVQGGVADATTTTKGKAVLLGGTADAPTVPWSKVTGTPSPPSSLPPSGGAGGVLSGTYPNPGFAVDMASQAEADAGDAATAATAAADAAAKVNTHRTASDPHGDRAWASGQFAPASLFVDGVLTTAALPAVAISETFSVPSQAAMLALNAQRGDMARRTDQGGALYWLAADPATTLANWLPIDVHGEVQSVNGQAGTVVLGAVDVGADPAGSANTARSQAATDATNKVAAHSVAADPHGDRAYADTGDAARAQRLIVTAIKTSASGAYTFAPADYVPADLSGGSFTLTLPTGVPDGSRVGYKVIGVATGALLTLACSGTDKFNRTTGPTTYTASLLGQAGMLQYQASAGLWIVQADDLPLSQLDGRYAALVHSHPVADISATGTRSSSTVLYGDGAWRAPASGAVGRFAWPSPPVGEWLLQYTQSANAQSRPDGLLHMGLNFLPPGTYDAVAFYVSTAGSAGALLKVVAYSDNAGKPGAQVLDTPAVDATSVGAKTITGLSVVVPAGGVGIWAGTVSLGGATTPAATTTHRADGYVGPSSTANLSNFGNFGGQLSAGWEQAGVGSPAPADLSTATRVHNVNHTRLAFRRSA